METEVQTEVIPERGQWAVYLLVLTPDGVSRRRLGTHRSEARARLAASVVSRTAARRRATGEQRYD